VEKTKFMQRYVIPVGDVPGHEVRVFKIHRTYPNNAPVINGLKLTEFWNLDLSD
jgi:hypothetical protein